MTAQRYEAAWIPWYRNDVDADDALELAEGWLAGAPCRAQRVIVTNTREALRGHFSAHPKLARYENFSPTSSRARSRTGNAVLALWPSNETLAFAETVATDGALCVVPGSIHDLTHWIRRTTATNLWDPASELESSDELPAQVRSALDSAIFFGGRNGFFGHEKVVAIRSIDTFIREGFRPSPEAVRDYALEKGVQPGGAEPLREWCAGRLAGKAFRDDGGRPI
ncbi:MAG: hypothetical protein O2822_05505 [Chloroflexi bacterium]|nr:hypothetical protein [Chloroflexota bacterium]